MSKRGRENSNSLFVKFFVTLALVSVVYFILGKLGLHLAFFHPSASPVWPATGFALATLIILGYRFWPAILLGAFLVNLTTEGTIFTSLGIAVGNCLESVLGAFFIQRFARGLQVLERPKTIFTFFLITLMVSIISATIGTLSLSFGGFASWETYSGIWITWWTGNVMGALIVFPLLISWWKSKENKISLGETALIILANIIVSALIFTEWSFISNEHYPIQIICIIPLLWACFRLKQLGATLAILIISAIAVFGTLSGYGPLSPYSPNGALLFLQIFIGFIALVGLIISSLVKK